MKLGALYEQIKDAFEYKQNAGLRFADIAVLFQRYINSYDNEIDWTIEYGGTPTHIDGPYADAHETTQTITFDIEDFYSTIQVSDVKEEGGKVILILNFSSKKNCITLDKFFEKISQMNPNSDVIYNDGKKTYQLNTTGEYGYVSIDIARPYHEVYCSNVKKCKFKLIICDNTEVNDPDQFEIEQYANYYEDEMNERAQKSFEDWQSYQEDPRGGDGFDD